jgi:hypothetical protein
MENILWTKTKFTDNYCVSYIIGASTEINHLWTKQNLNGGW